MYTAKHQENIETWNKSEVFNNKNNNLWPLENEIKWQAPTNIIDNIEHQLCVQMKFPTADLIRRKNGYICCYENSNVILMGKIIDFNEENKILIQTISNDESDNFVNCSISNLQKYDIKVFGTMQLLCKHLV